MSHESREVLDILAEQTDVIGRILNDVLSLQRLEAVQLKLEYKPFNIQRFILSTVQAFGAEFQAKQLTVEVICGAADEHRYLIAQDGVITRTDQLMYQGTLHTVIADPHRLRQVLANFISNGKYASHRGHQAVESQSWYTDNLVVQLCPVFHSL